MTNNILFIGNNTIFYDWFIRNSNKYRVTYLNSADNPEESINNNQINLIILVVEENFFQDVSAIEKIKANDDYRDLTVILIDKSPFFIPNNIKLAFQSGISDYLHGDFDLIEFESRLDHQLKTQRRYVELKDENEANKEALSHMDQIQLLMDRADNSFIMFDQNGEPEWVNQGFIRLYGYSLDEFKRKFGRTIYESSRNSDIKTKIDRCIKTKKSVNYVSEFKTRTGEYKWIQTTFTPVLTPTGNIERFIAIETDITKLKETEEALNQKNEYMLALTSHLQSANNLLEEQQREINAQNNAIAEEKRISDELLRNILPYEITRQLKSKGEVTPRQYKNATVLFLDFVNFTSLTRELSPQFLVNLLDTYFKKFDDITDTHFIEKIKTIGDAYMCVGGLPLSNKSHPFDVVLAGLEMQHYVNNMIEKNITPAGQEWKCRIGIHTGPVIAGVVGRKKYIYDVWGETVNTAARIQQDGVIGRVNISGHTYSHIKDYFDCEYRGQICPKHSMPQDSYFVNRLKENYASDQLGLTYNESFTKVLNAL
jgi:PAS domain S-box-containing protein